MAKRLGKYFFKDCHICHEPINARVLFAYFDFETISTIQQTTSAFIFDSNQLIKYRVGSRMKIA